MFFRGRRENAAALVQYESPGASGADVNPQYENRKPPSAGYLCWYMAMAPQII